MTDLVVIEENFPMVASSNSLAETIENNMGGEDLSVREMFLAVPNPSGGAEQWTIKTPFGTKTIDKIEGIILHIGFERSYFSKPFRAGSAEPPDCSSNDGREGRGTPGGNCGECSMAEFGPNKEAPACKERRPIYLLAPEINPSMPVVINVLGTSARTLRKFRAQMTQGDIKLQQALVKLTLRSETTQNDQPASVIQFEAIKDLRSEDPAGLEKIEKYREELIGIVDANLAEARDLAQAAAQAADDQAA